MFQLKLDGVLVMNEETGKPAVFEAFERERIEFFKLDDEVLEFIPI